MSFRSVVVAITILPALAFASAGPLRATEPEPVHGIAMHGDVKYGRDFAHFDYVDPNAPKGGTVRLSSTGTFDSLNPFIVKGRSGAGVGAIYDTLLTRAEDEPFTEYGLLAESIRVPKDRSWVEFTLHKQARFHDGMPVTVDDVIWSFETLVEKGQPLYRYYYGNVAKVSVTGQRSVRFDFTPGKNRELPLILGQIPVLPKHHWADREFDRTTLELPLGSGPYRVARVDPGRSITLERVDDYWGRDLPVNIGQDNFDTIIYEYYRDNTVALEAFKAGAFDYRAENSSKAWASEYDIPAVRDGLLIKAEIEQNRTAGMQGFVFNTRRDMFRDKRVRQALAYAFDFEWSNANLFYGQMRRSRSYFDNSELSATGLPEGTERTLLEPFRDQLPPEVFTEVYNPPTTDGPGGLRGNLRQASRLLGEAGWVVRDGQRVNAETGQPLSFEILLVSPLFERIVLPFAQNLERLGVTINVRTVDSAQYLRRLDIYDFDVVVGSFPQSASPGNEQRVFWSSSVADQEGGRNLMGVKDPVIDALIEDVIAAPDRDWLVAATRALDRVLQWGYWVIPQWYLEFDRIAYWNMFGRPEVIPDGGSVFSTWWVDPEKYEALQKRRRNSGG